MHPFIEDWLVLCHNGTLSNHYTVALNNEIEKATWDIDSQVIAKVLAKDKTPAVFSEINGSFACLMTDKSLTKTNTLFVVRNTERELFYGFLEEGMYISSIKASLEFIGCTGIELFNTQKLISVIDGKIAVEKPLNFFTPPPVATSSYTGPYNTQMTDAQWLALENCWGYTDSQDRNINYQHLTYPSMFAKYPKNSPIFVKKVVVIKDRKTNANRRVFFVMDADGQVYWGNETPLTYGFAAWEFKKGNKAICTTDLTFSKSGNKIASKGQEVEVTDTDDEDNLVYFKHPTTDQEVNVPKKYLIPKMMNMEINKSNLHMLEVPCEADLLEADVLIAQYIKENSVEVTTVPPPIIHKTNDKTSKLSAFGEFLYNELNLSLDVALEEQKKYEEDENLKLISKMVGEIYENMLLCRNAKEDTIKPSVEFLVEELAADFMKLYARLKKVKIVNNKELVL